MNALLKLWLRVLVPGVFLGVATTMAQNAPLIKVASGNESAPADVVLTLGNMTIESGGAPVMPFQVSIKNVSNQTIFAIIHGKYYGLTFYTYDKNKKAVELVEDSDSNGPLKIESSMGPAGAMPIAPGAIYVIKREFPKMILSSIEGAILTSININLLTQNGEQSHYLVFSNSALFFVPNQ